MTEEQRLALDNCIKCSICVTHCPVAKVTDIFAGPKQNGPDWERFRLEEPTAVHPSIGYCSNCKTCDVVCPSGVNVSTMNAKAKGEYVALHGAPFRDMILARVELLGKASRLAPSLVNWLAGNKPLRLLGEKFMGVSSQMTMPKYARQTFLQMYQPKKIANSKDKVVYFPGCYVNYNTPEVGLALAEILARHGIELTVEQFNCCGLPLIANGFLDVAKAYAQKNLSKLQQYVQQGYRIITTCPSCHLSLSREYQELFALDTSQLNDQIFDAFEYLNMLKQEGKINLELSRVNRRVGYHQPCHLKAIGSGIPSLETLRNIPGLEVTELDAGCCGISGSYGFKKEKYQISQEIGQNIRQAVEELSVDEVITECGTCQLQVQHLTGAEVYHPMLLLAEAIGQR
ncbi:anaerobic glycerol-3-phosphate dehydrogenase subunit C [Desulforamulus ferrireducens]|uniref:sn-glycerol-3-phosphate dehydrogenase subunit C n=1 Tax=Desulforamulus ferrireducens TaxID=1833852 RepID=A0A1S6IVR0_9FIRM|nr:anaerobic glycerol-3-phosphate dehydrogenase subunit C [Desulforamulus ferrireducens]AQS58865.1 sn-glycerol-3-phosphate dehydrogenase subunit C [Desulforamulus ferrireducens]